MTNKNIVLIGFMGCGKSTVGKIIAEEIAYSHIDTDSEIERISKQSIASIFEQRGEAYFRDLESSLCLSLANSQKTVISTGGGIIKRQENILNLKKNASVFYLASTADNIMKNLKDTNDRPLLRAENDWDKLALINRLLSERAPAYEENADFIINVSAKSPRQIKDEIVKLFFKI